MKVNIPRVVADILSIIISGILTPVFLFLYFVRIILCLLDKSEEVRAKTVLVTGTTSGLGRAVAKKYAQTAENLILVARNKDKLESVIEECKSINPECKVKTVVADLSDCEDYLKKMEECAKKEEVRMRFRSYGR